MEQHRNPNHALAPAAPYLAGFLVVYAALSSIAWLAGELAGWLWTRRWPPAGGSDALAVLLYLSRDPGHPSLAWPAAARQDLAPALLFYAIVVVLLLAVTIPFGRLTLARLAHGRPWADPNPRRAGFATSGGLTTLSAAPAVGAGLTLDLVDLGPERDSQGPGHDAPRRRLGHVGPPGRADDGRLGAPHCAHLRAPDRAGHGGGEFRRGWLSEWLSSSDARKAHRKMLYGRKAEPQHLMWT